MVIRSCAADRACTLRRTVTAQQELIASALTAFGVGGLGFGGLGVWGLGFGGWGTGSFKLLSGAFVTQ